MEKMDTTGSNKADFAAFAQLVCSLVRVPNPQYEVNGEPGEAALAKAVVAWLKAHNIQTVECDLEWGVHAVLTGPDGAGTRPGILLAAHLDSDHLNTPDVSKVAVDGTKLLTPGQVGLDCKTGVAIALSVLERLQGRPGAWQVHILFTVGEEAGQKGAIRAPIARLLGGKVRLGIVIDRMTNGSNAPVDTNGSALRHAVSSYKGVPLLEESSGVELIRHLNAGVTAADPKAASAGALPLIESPNNADALELRGRFDAEVIAPSVQAPSKELTRALSDYSAATSRVLQAMKAAKPEVRISSMYSSPRMPRYNAMRGVYDALHRGDVSYDHARLGFSCVNLSYDYDDAEESCDLMELDRTARLLLAACESYFESK